MIKKKVLIGVAALVAFAACALLLGSSIGLTTGIQAIPFIDPHSIPFIDPHAIPFIDPHAIPFIDPHAIPFIDPHAIPFIDPHAVAL
ncbi:MAG: hypothetical protein LLG21_06985 [Euryarchaeota archaeon]|nr:hypothetical protein [Euryarchaeota archaeon]